MRDSLRCDATYPPSPKTDAKAHRAPAAIQHTVREHYASVRRCYEDLLKTNGEARGKFQTHFTIAPDGSVTTRCVDPATTIDDQVLGECVLKEFSAMNFGPDDGYTTVIYPIVFAPVVR